MDIALRAFYHVPVIGWMAKDAVQGAPDAKYYFAANIAVLYAALVYLIGYPFVIVTALVAAVLVLSTIVFLTALDFFDTAVRKRRHRAQMSRPR
ncbi:MAG: hypothetical protein ACO1NY_14300 [Pseudorhodoplanes sp.]